MRKVYLVIGADTVFAIFYSAEDARLHQASIERPTTVVERTVFTGQANRPGFNL